MTSVTDPQTATLPPIDTESAAAGSGPTNSGADDPGTGSQTASQADGVKRDAKSLFRRLMPAVSAIVTAIVIRAIARRRRQSRAHTATA